MHDRFIAFDVETPNYANDRMSAIGISVVENAEIVEEQYYLVNPEARFDAFNISLTGITPDMVAQQPTFSQLWRVIEPIMSSGVLVAHNAPFDMGVLSKCLRAYRIDWQLYARYACTCSMGRRCYPGFPNHKLNTMCDCLDIELDHHNAGSDSRACALLLIDYIKSGLQVERFIRSYDMGRC